MAKIKNKKSNLADNYAKIRKQQLNKKTLTPFEIHVNKTKQNVLGRKSKVDHGLPGIARTKAITKRKNTLLLEYKVKDKDNIFLDRRIGEKNSGMSEEDKAMARFAAERIKAHKKKDIFNLNDEEILTHRGQSLIDIEKYDNPRSDEDDYSDDENKTGKLDKKFVEDAHFGGGVLSKSTSQMSRKDLIDQLIYESKKRKAERQKIREQTIDLTEKLDSEWHDLLPLVSSSKLKEIEDKPKVDDYDISLRTLKYEARGMPTDKLKSEEEIVKKEKLALEKLEEDRLMRMKGFSDEAEFQRNHKSADDLDNFKIERIEDKSSDNESNDDKIKLIKLCNAEITKNKKNNSEEEVNNEIDQDNDDDKEDEEGNKIDEDSDENIEEESDNLSDLKDSDSSDNEKEENVEDKAFANANNIQAVEKALCKNIECIKGNNIKANDDSIASSNNSKADVSIGIKEAMMEKARQELPYTFTAPVTYKELQALIKDYNPDYQSVVIERIIKCNHWKLSNENKEKLSNLFSFLLQYLNDCTFGNDLEELTKFFQLFDRLCPHLYDLTHANPESTKLCLHDILKEKHSIFEKSIKTYPKLDTLFLFKLVSILYPTSDFRHPIVTPCLVFMSQILFKCKVRRKQDISKGLFLCTLILEYTILNKRWSPSVINFLRGIIFISLPKPFSKLIKVLPPFKTANEFSNLLVLEEDQKNLKVNSVTTRMLIEDLCSEALDDSYRLRTFITTINLLHEFKEQYKELDSAYYIFEPILTLLKYGSLERYPAEVKKKVNDLVADLTKLNDKKLKYLVFNKKKPKALRMYEPRIEVVYDGKKHKPMSKAKAEREKLLHKLKKETKSAIREVRKDNAFLSKVKIKQQIASDIERKRKVKEIFGDAAKQQSEIKKFKRK
ncbi:PREDICTED: nucleolar protein 14 homolog [Ceratosolen solmsi marchali]|uniref:Nucleolar protein 14 homolog n=1 Tax=Ceratosolen solmsi marchali TaxID=326594 RepID=A0AAJ7E2B5_9HYME|nr:PREDICTED: nucleolar protein 14 homolog [Ceratosolen solmsi marchali]